MNDPNFWQDKCDANPEWTKRFLRGSQGVQHPSRTVVRDFLSQSNFTSTLLDVGCGPGVTYESFAGLPLDYTGIDRTPAMVEKFKENHPEARVQVEDALEFLTQCNSYGAVHIRALLEHLDPDTDFGVFRAALEKSELVTIVTFFIPPKEGTSRIQMAKDGSPVYNSTYGKDDLNHVIIEVAAERQQIPQIKVIETEGHDQQGGNRVWFIHWK